MVEDSGTLLFKDKQTRIILSMLDERKEWYLSELAKNSGVTYIHTSRFIKRCETSGLVHTEKHGRTKRVLLTEKGKSIANGLKLLMAEVAKHEPAAQENP